MSTSPLSQVVFCCQQALDPMCEERTRRMSSSPPPSLYPHHLPPFSTSLMIQLPHLYQSQPLLPLPIIPFLLPQLSLLISPHPPNHAAPVIIDLAWAVEPHASPLLDNISMAVSVWDAATTTDVD